MADGKKLVCVYPGCNVGPLTDGGYLERVNPKGEPFEGACSAHYEHVFNEEDCDSCGAQNSEEKCPASKKACGHHCNHSWSHDHCHWCGKEWGES